MFIDRVRLELHAGKGGNGVVAWRREKYIPKGGPYGGNGGAGGSIYIQADAQLASLDWFRQRRLIKAENGQQGGSNCRQGRRGKNLILQVPCGTLVKDSATGTILHDLTQDREKQVICSGGKGGLGNAFFKSSTNRAPNRCTPGKLGESLRVELELKLIADVGLVGFPNAGKSTLVSTLANRKLKTAAYPFTTLKPNLGCIESFDGNKILIADIPGIIEGAHHNRGLGFEFLRHIERTHLLLFVLDASGIDGRNPADDFVILKNELAAYNPHLLERPHLVILNKCDTDESASHLKEFYSQNSNIDPSIIYEVAAICYQGTDELSTAIQKQVHRIKERTC